MQKYLLPFVLTGNLNSLWPDDKLQWPSHSSYSTGSRLVFNNTIYVADDELSSNKFLC